MVKKTSYEVRCAFKMFNETQKVFLMEKKKKIESSKKKEIESSFDRIRRKKKDC